MDRIFESWLQAQSTEWQELAGETDRVKVTPLGQEPWRKFVVEFDCKGLVRSSDGVIGEADKFAVGIYFGDDHLRRVEPLNLVWLLSPANVWHPNVRFPIICPGHLRPAVGLVEILYQVYSILTYQNFHLTDHLNADAATWARENRSRFPIDNRPLKRRQLELEILEVAQ